MDRAIEYCPECLRRVRVPTRKALSRPPLLKPGDQGLRVWTLQQLLNRWSPPGSELAESLHETGVYGHETERAVKAFQRVSGISESGLLGPRTWRLLLDNLQLDAEHPEIGKATDDRYQENGEALESEFLDLVATPFETVILSNVAMASRISVPSYYGSKLKEYSRSNWLDGTVLFAGYLRSPRFYSGGWILNLVSAAKAITLNKAVFVEGSLDIATYIHEVVHVAQYKALGITGFLTSYFGSSALTILARWLAGKATNPMKSSPHEIQAYNIEGRFSRWLASQP